MRKYGRYTIEISNEDKVLFPDCGLTKGRLIDYYESVSEHFVRHATDRPLTMQRFPDGIDTGGFYQKQIGDYFPRWIKRASVRTSEGRQQQVLCNNQATLAYLANQACVTAHLFSSRVDRLDIPDRMTIDLDPPGDAFDAVRLAAIRCRRLFDELGLSSFVKTTGSRGLHVVVPLRREEGYDRVREFARRFASTLASRYPDELTTEQRKAKRRGRLYLDVGRNAYAQTAVAPYAVRALPGAPVATPLEWAELEETSLHARSFDVGNVVRRIEANGDAWRGLGRAAQSLSRPRRRLEALSPEEC